MAAFLASLTLAALAGWLAQRSRHGDALRWWALGSVLATGGALLNVSQGLLPATVALAIGNPLMAWGVGLLIDGTHRLTGRPPRPLLWLVPMLCLMAAALWWGAWWPNLPHRAAVFSLVTVWLLGCLLAALWPLRKAGARIGLAFVGASALLLGGMVLARTALAWQGGPPSLSGADKPLSMAVYLAGAMALIAIQTGMLLIHQLLLIDTLRSEAQRDPLTGLLNRHALASRLPPSLAGWALVAADIDHFKHVNDTHGHAAGDQVLSFVGEVLQRHLRAGDLAVRMGGEEFAVLLHDMPAGAAQAVAERLRAELERLAPQRCGHPITASLGVALATGAADFAMLWSQADAALYQAKQNGRNRVELAAALRGTP